MAFPRPLSLLAVLGAALVATAGWSFLFRRTEPPRPVDPLLGAVLEVRFEADLPWKREFPAAGSTVRVDGILRAAVEAVDLPEPGAPARRRVRLRVLDRAGQEPWAWREFRWGIVRGSTVALQDEPAPGGIASLVNGEVVSVEMKKP